MGILFSQPQNPTTMRIFFLVLGPLDQIVFYSYVFVILGTTKLQISGGRKIQSIKWRNRAWTPLSPRQAWWPGFLWEHWELRELWAADPVLEQPVVLQQPAAGTVLRQLRLRRLPHRPAWPQAQGHLQRLCEGALRPQQGQTRHSRSSACRIHRYKL